MTSEQGQTGFSGGYFQVSLVCANCCDFPGPFEFRRLLRGKVEQSEGGQLAEFPHVARWGAHLGKQRLESNSSIVHLGEPLFPPAAQRTGESLGVADRAFEDSALNIPE